MKKIILSVALLFTISLSYSQDTIPAHYFKMCKNRQLDRRTGEPFKKQHIHWKKVKSGYVVKEKDGTLIVDKKTFTPEITFHLQQQSNNHKT